jgi:hypothetical protein
MDHFDEYRTCGVVRPSLWAKDHLTALMYLESHLTDRGPFWARPNEKMRTNPYTFGRDVPISPGVKRWDIFTGHNSTKLVEGALVDGHDDWSCLWDMGALGLLSYHPTKDAQGHFFQVKLTPTGDSLVAELRRLRRAGLTKIYDIPRNTHSWMALEAAYELLLEGAPKLRGPETAKLRYIERIDEDDRYYLATSSAGEEGVACRWNLPVSFYDPDENPGHLFPDMVAQLWRDTPVLVMV